MCGCSTWHPCRHAVFEKDWHRLLFGKGDGVSFLCLPSEIYLTYANPLTSPKAFFKVMGLDEVVDLDARAGGSAFKAV